MKEKLLSIYNRLRNFLRESFGYPGVGDYIDLDSSEIRKKLHSKIYFLNCQRLLAVMPIMFIVNALVLLYAGGFHHDSEKYKFFFMYYYPFFLFLHYSWEHLCVTSKTLSIEPVYVNFYIYIFG